MIHVKRNEIHLTSHYIPDEKKFYYHILYRENGIWYEGFGSYCRENVEKWLKEYFIIED